MTHAVFPALDPDRYQRHPLHAAERDWPETNCYLDVWIEVLPSLGLPPEACLAYSVTQDFEGDQFTFFKVPLEDLESLYGLRVTELAIYDRVESHVQEQIDRGRLSLVEVDSFYLPDTQGVGYHQAHGKTTIAINRIDVDNRRLDYFHGLGLHRLTGDDFDGVFQRTAQAGAPLFLPYTEFVKLPLEPVSQAQFVERSQQLLVRHLARRPVVNPIAAFAEVFPDQVARVADRPFDFFHLYAFNTLRQLGANFELFAAYLAWLGNHKVEGLDTAHQASRQISTTCKSLQFQLARAVMRKKFDNLQPALAPAVESWDLLMSELDGRFATRRDRAA